MIFFPVFHTIQVFGYSWSTQKPRFHMDKRHLVKWRIANFGLFLELFDYFRFRWFFPLFKKFGFWGILGPPYCGIGAAMRIDREMLCLPYAGFLSNVFTILICSRIYWKSENIWKKKALHFLWFQHLEFDISKQSQIRQTQNHWSVLRIT